MSRVSIYFFAGDFADVLSRFEDGREQLYQTHNEVARMVHDFVRNGHELDIYSFVTPERVHAEPLPGVRIFQLGASNWSARGLLQSALARDDSDAIIAHFSNFELLDAVASKSARSMVVMANSHNRRGPAAIRHRTRLRRTLNQDKFEWVVNHCLPATRQLADFGVSRRKLIAWDVPHPFTPASQPTKPLPDKQAHDLIYVGSLVEDKGVGDIICAMSKLRQDGVTVRCSFAGAGDLDKMRALGDSLGVSDALQFLGLIGNDQVFALMQTSDVVLVPSRTIYTEGFPLTMFEAIASRTPIVCSDHPMFRANMLDNANASVFKSGDVDSLAAAIKRTLTDPDLYFQLSKNADMTWQSLKGPADWRSILNHWVSDPNPSEWLQAHSLDERE